MRHTRMCSFPECPRTQKAKGLCAAHYIAAQRGRPLVPIASPPRVCGMPDCERTASAATYCAKHYKRLKANGRADDASVRVARPAVTPIGVRLLRRVRFRDDGCWEWTGNRHAFGYGLIQVSRARNEGTHRVMWKLAHGPIPKGMWVLHRCDHPWCVNPEHLFLGTPADNIHDMMAKGRRGRPVPYTKHPKRVA